MKQKTEEKKSKTINLIVLYKKNTDLIVFDFNYCEDDECIGNERDLIIFHFTERHDFEERVETVSKAIFKNFFAVCSEEEELIDWEHISKKV